eukprot:2618602-Prymnesium_polylepis.1
MKVDGATISDGGQTAVQLWDAGIQRAPRTLTLLRRKAGAPEPPKGVRDLYLSLIHISEPTRRS